jgi:uncharacterized membrane protein
MQDPSEDHRPDAEPLDPHLGRRLFIAFLVIAALGLTSAIFLPRAGLSVPWYVFAITFAAIVAAALAPLFEGREDPATADEEPAGQIGRDDGP